MTYYAVISACGNLSSISFFCFRISFCWAATDDFHCGLTGIFFLIKELIITLKKNHFISVQSEEKTTFLEHLCSSNMQMLVTTR